MLEENDGASKTAMFSAKHKTFGETLRGRTLQYQYSLFLIQYLPGNAGIWLYVCSKQQLTGS